MQSHFDVIKAFGGLRPFAEAIGVKPATAIHWPTRGIPSKYWPGIERATALWAIPVTTHDLAAWPVGASTRRKRSRKVDQHAVG